MVINGHLNQVEHFKELLSLPNHSSLRFKSMFVVINFNLIIA